MGYSFLIGGARSGKSTLAVQLAHRAESRGDRVVFVVTAEALDDEMGDRIARHQAERPTNWAVIEAPRRLLAGLSQADSGFVVLDCLSFWVANLVMDEQLTDDDIESAARDVAQHLMNRESSGVVVSNEVGLSLVPEHALGRRFRDVLGRVNAILAASAHTASFVVAGRILELQPPRLD